eukprot:7961458-Pyramimonas_sp.AAC.1
MLSFAPPGGGGGGGAAEAARGGGRGGGGARGGGHAGGICPLLSPDWSEPRGIYAPSSRLTGPRREVHMPPPLAGLVQGARYICSLLSPDWSKPRGICPLLSPDWSKPRDGGGCGRAGGAATRRAGRND